jgi:hypothetical protein
MSLSGRHPEVRAKRASKGDGVRDWLRTFGGRSSFEGGLRPPPQDDGLTPSPWPIVVGLVTALAATSAQAEEKLTGRWAVDPSACSGFSASLETMPLVVSNYAVRWHGDACRIARVYKTGDDVHIQALCWGAHGERSVPVSLRPHAGTLELRWDHVVSDGLRRCD